MTLALLHEGSSDEVMMVAVGLGVAYLVILWSGRRKSGDDDEYEDDDIATETPTVNRQPTGRRADGRSPRRAPVRRTRHSRDGGLGSASIGAANVPARRRRDSLQYTQAEVAERQTRRSQTPLRATSPSWWTTL